MTGDVLDVAWQASGCPPVQVPVVAEGRCARCSARAQLVAVGKAVSAVFTGYDTWSDPAGVGLCQVCVWGYRSKHLRAGAHHVFQEPVGLVAVDRAGVVNVLTAGALPDDEALVVPLRPGRKHLFPGARWGQVTTDHAGLVWSVGDARRLRTMRWLRGCGFGTRMLAEPAAPYAVLSRLPADQWPLVLQAWAALQVWREPDNPWMAVACWAVAGVKPGFGAGGGVADGCG